MAAARADATDLLLWTPDLELAADCSDFFYWASADSEPIENDDDVRLLLTALEDTNYDYSGIYLYAAQHRQMQPQGEMYEHLPPKFHGLFDRAGPHRLPSFQNPTERKEQ